MDKAIAGERERGGEHQFDIQMDDLLFDDNFSIGLHARTRPDTRSANRFIQMGPRAPFVPRCGPVIVLSYEWDSSVRVSESVSGNK